MAFAAEQACRPRAIKELCTGTVVVLRKMNPRKMVHFPAFPEVTTCLRPCPSYFFKLKFRGSVCSRETFHQEARAGVCAKTVVVSRKVTSRSDALLACSKSSRGASHILWCFSIKGIFATPFLKFRGGRLLGNKRIAQDRCQVFT